MSICLVSICLRTGGGGGWGGCGWWGSWYLCCRTIIVSVNVPKARVMNASRAVSDLR